MKFKLEDFNIEIIEYSVKVKGGRADSSMSAGCTSGDQGCCDNDVKDDPPPMTPGQ